MPTPSEGRRLPRLNMLALFVAAAASLATLADNTPHGRSSSWAEWSGEAQRVHITVLPVEDRIDSFGYEGTLYLDIEMDDVAEGAVDAMRWALTAEPSGGAPFHAEGGFVFGDYNGQTRGGQDYGDATARIGPLCAPGAASDPDCVPCSVELGCTMVLGVDRCRPVEEGLTRVEVALARADGDTFHMDCPEDGDQAPCDRLDEWLQVETTPADARLCPAEAAQGGEGDASAG